MKARTLTLSIGLISLVSAALPMAATTVGRKLHHLSHRDSGYPTYNTTKKLYAKTDLRGKQAPALSVEKWLTGKAPETKGKVVLIDFWATWCPPCRETIPELGKWQKTYSKDLVVIGISNEDPEVVREFMQKTQMPYNVAVDSSQKMSKVLGVEGIPHVLVVTPDGIVRWQGFPLDAADPLNDEVLKQIISASKAAHKSAG